MVWATWAYFSGKYITGAGDSRGYQQHLRLDFAAKLNSYILATYVYFECVAMLLLCSYISFQIKICVIHSIISLVCVMVIL